MTATYTRGTKTTKVTTLRAAGAVLLTIDGGDGLALVAHTKTGAVLREAARIERVAPGAYERNTRIVVHFTDGTRSIGYSSSQTWMALTESVAASEGAPVAAPIAIAVPAAATRQEVTVTVPAPARFAAVREDGRYRVVTTGVGAAAPGRVVATCSSKAKAEEKAAKLNADAAPLAADLAEAPAVVADTAKLTEEQAATITRDPVGAVADAIRSGRTDFLGTVGELLGGATLDQIAARQNTTPAAARVLPRTDVEDRVEASMARKGPAPEVVAKAVARFQAELDATAPALGKIMSEPLPGEVAPVEEPTKAYRIGKVLREFVLSRPVPAGTGELVAHVATRYVCYDGTATLRLTRAMAERLIDAAGDLEVAVTGSADENPVPVAQRAPAVMAARAARRSLYKLFA